jgi:hypothetical protein
MVATKKMTHLEFIQKAYETLRKPGKDGKQYMGMHVVYTGFNEAFRKYFDTDPIKAVTKLADSGEVRVRAARGGAIIYLGDDVPAGGGDKALEKMGLA